MEQATDAEKAMSVAEFLDFKRRNKVWTILMLLSCQKSLLLMYDWLLPVSLQSFPGSFIGIYVENYTRTHVAVHYNTLHRTM